MKMKINEYKRICQWIRENKELARTGKGRLAARQQLTFVIPKDDWMLAVDTVLGTNSDRQMLLYQQAAIVKGVLRSIGKLIESMEARVGPLVEDLRIAAKAQQSAMETIKDLESELRNEKA